LSGGVAAHLATGVEQRSDQHRQHPVAQVRVHQQGFGGPADAGAAHLGVEHDGARLVQVRRAVDVGMADALQVLEQGHLAFRRDPFDQGFAAARHDHVDDPGHGEHLAHRGAVGGGHALDRRGGQARSLEPVHQTGVDGGGRGEAFRAAAQDRGVAGLEAQRAGVGGDVGAAFVDDADHPQRHGDAADQQPVGAFPLGQHAAHRIGQPGDVLQALGHGLDALGIEHQAVDHRRREALVRGRRHVLGVGFEDFLPARADRPGAFGQRQVLGVRRGGRQVARGGLGGFAKRAHHRGNILGLSVHFHLPRFAGSRRACRRGS